MAIVSNINMTVNAAVVGVEVELAPGTITPTTNDAGTARAIEKWQVVEHTLNSVKTTVTSADSDNYATFRKDGSKWYMTVKATGVGSLAILATVKDGKLP
jgi:hypothetical protein